MDAFALFDVSDWSSLYCFDSFVRITFRRVRHCNVFYYVVLASAATSVPDTIYPFATQLRESTMMQ